MYKVYLKQAIAMLRENPFLGTISVVGTALAISMIMVIVIVYEIRNANYRPEVHRDRMLYISGGTVIGKKGGDGSSRLSLKTIRACYLDLPAAEAVAVTGRFQPKLASIPAGGETLNSDLLYTNADFWRVFEFHFIHGRPYTEADVSSGIRTVVVSESVARRLYGSVEVTGQPIQLNYEDYTICGVVSDVSLLAQSSYSQIWLPYTTDETLQMSFMEDILGLFRVCLLLKEGETEKSAKAEIEQRVRLYNASLSDYEYVLNGYPDNQFEKQIRSGFTKPDVKGTILRYAVIILVLLFVPAINLSGMTLSRMRKRMSEIGICKAFGATKSSIVMQILTENLLISLAGGLIGLVFSYAALLLLKGWLLGYAQGRDISGEAFLNVDMLFSPMVFIYAFAFCLVLNLLSAGIPAYRIASGTIVDALKGE